MHHSTNTCHQQLPVPSIFCCGSHLWNGLSGGQVISNFQLFYRVCMIELSRRAFLQWKKGFSLLHSSLYYLYFDFLNFLNRVFSLFMIYLTQFSLFHCFPNYAIHFEDQQRKTGLSKKKFRSHYSEHRHRQICY